jgi:hypothetical protein
VPFQCPGPPEKDGGAVRPRWPFGKGSASLMKSE